MNFMQSIRHLEHTMEREQDADKRRHIRNVIKGMVIKMELMGEMNNAN